MELMDPKLQLVTGCALVAFFSHTNLSLFNIHLSTPVHKYGRSTSPEYYYSAASIQSDP